MKKTMKRLMVLMLSLAVIMICVPCLTNVANAEMMSGYKIPIYPNKPLYVGEKFSDVKLFSFAWENYNPTGEITNIKFYEVKDDVKSPCTTDSFKKGQEYAVEFEWTPLYDDIRQFLVQDGRTIPGDCFVLMKTLPSGEPDGDFSFHRDYSESGIYEWHDKTNGSKTKVVTLRIGKRELHAYKEFNYYLKNETGDYDKVSAKDIFKPGIPFADIAILPTNDDTVLGNNERLAKSRINVTAFSSFDGDSLVPAEPQPTTFDNTNYFLVELSFGYNDAFAVPYNEDRLILDGNVLKEFNVASESGGKEFLDPLATKFFEAGEDIEFNFFFAPYYDDKFVEDGDLTIEDIKPGDSTITVDVSPEAEFSGVDKFVLLAYKGNFTEEDLFKGGALFNKFPGVASSATIDDDKLVFSNYVYIVDSTGELYKLDKAVNRNFEEGDYTFILMPDYGTNITDRKWGYNNAVVLHKNVDGPRARVLTIKNAKIGETVSSWYTGIRTNLVSNNSFSWQNLVCFDEYELFTGGTFEKGQKLHLTLLQYQTDCPTDVTIKAGTDSAFKNVTLKRNPNLVLYGTGVNDLEVNEYVRDDELLINSGNEDLDKFIDHYDDFENCYNYSFDYERGCYNVIYRFTLDLNPIEIVDVKGYILEGYNSRDFSFPTNGTVETKKWFVDNIEQTEDFDFEKGKEYKLSLKLTDVNVEPKDGIRIGNTLITDKSVDEASLALATSSSYFYDEDEHTLSIIYIDTVKEPINVDLKFGQGFIEEDFDFYNSSNEVNELLAKKDYENYTVSVEGVYEDEALTNDAKDVDKAVLGTTYYAKLHIQPKVDHTFNNTTLFVDGLPYDENHPNYIGEATSDGNGGFFIAAKLETKKISEFTPSLNMMNKDIKKPSDINLGTSTGEDIEDEDAFGSLFVKNATDSYYGAVALDKIEFYKDDKFVKGMNSSENFGDNKFYIKAVYDLSNIYGNGDLLSDILSGRNDSELALDVRNSFASPDSYVVMSTNNGYYGQYIRPVYTKVNKKDRTMEIGYEWKDISSAPHITGISLENKTDTEVTLKVTGTNLSKENAHVSIIKVNGGSLGSSKQLQSDPNCTVVDGNTMQFTFQLEEPMGSDECLVNIGNSIDGYQPLVYSFTFGINKQTSSGSKKYKATDSNDTAEKISGSGKKGSKRTITPEEGRKVSNVVVTDKQGNRVDVTKNADGTYSFIQPASDVNIEVSYKNREITLNIGSTEASVDGERETLDVTPVIRNDRTMLPIRFVAENLGAKVEWSEKNPNYVLITKGDIKIEITLGSDKMLVNGKEVKLDSVAFAENDRTYLPVRAVSENLNAIVEWNEARPMEVKIYER